MAWSSAQKSLAARACLRRMDGDAEAAREYRERILSQRAWFGNRAVHQGRVTSTSPRLNHQDFERFMAVLEEDLGGVIPIGGKDGDGFAPDYWGKRSGDPDRMLRWKVQQAAKALERTPGRDGQPLLAPGGAGLAGWIERTTGGRTACVDELTRIELGNVFEGLKSYGQRHGCRVT